MSARTSEHYHNNLSNEDSYDDSYVRGESESIWLFAFGDELINNPDGYGIDKLFLKDPTRGVELEHGGWDNDDYWSDPKFSRKSGELDYPTLNMPLRKLKFWEKDMLPKLLRSGDWVKRPNILNHRDTIFMRANQSLTQFILVRPDAILNKRYVIKDIYCSNSDKIEPFCCFKREDTETYNIVGGLIIKS
jgi:hypothetical protein